MKKSLIIILILALVIHIIPLSPSANSMDGFKTEEGPNILMMELEESGFVKIDEKFEVKLDKEWNIKFSGEVTKDNIQNISIDKNNSLIPTEFIITGTNQVIVLPQADYEPDSRYCLKIILKNGNKYRMYFNTLVSKPIEDLKIELEILNLANVERAKVGIGPLKLGELLTEVARLKSQDMADNDYFDHTSPTYGSPFDMMKQFGIKYTTAGENIACGHTSPEVVISCWMNSPGHKKNILNPNFGTLGVGYVIKNGTKYWTQMFTN